MSVCVCIRVLSCLFIIFFNLIFYGIFIALLFDYADKYNLKLK